MKSDAGIWFNWHFLVVLDFKAWWGKNISRRKQIQTVIVWIIVECRVSPVRCGDEGNTCTYCAEPAADEGKVGRRTKNDNVVEEDTCMDCNLTQIAMIQGWRVHIILATKGPGKCVRKEVRKDGTNWTTSVQIRKHDHLILSSTWTYLSTTEKVKLSLVVF